MSQSIRTQFLHLDSATAAYTTDINNTTGVTANAYRAQYLFPYTFSRVKRCYLKSVELPVGFSNVRKGSTDTFKFALNSTAYSVTLPEKNYTTIATLLTDINAALVGVVSGVTITFWLSTSLTTPNRILITFTGGTAVTSFNVVDTNLSKYIFGFRQAKDTLVSSVYAASFANYNLNADNFINIYIPTLNGQNANMAGQQSTFKLPLNTITNQIYYYQSGSSFEQFVDITDSNLNISGLMVIITDRWGQNLSPMGLDYSMTLALELWQ
jgi:hypothetical protein